MPRLGRFARELRWRLWKVPLDEEVDSELEFHLEMLVRENVTRGMDPGAARTEARRRFGNVARINQACRDLGRKRDQEMKRAEWLGELRQDVRYAFRHLRANPTFTAVAVLTLAVGIGASTTIFGIANAVLLRPFPFREPDRIVRVWETNPSTDRFAVSEPNYLDWRERSRSFDELAAYRWGQASLVGDGDPEQLTTIAVTHNFFPVFGVPALIGRTLVTAETQPGSTERVAVLSAELWQRRFGGDPAMVGRTISLDGTQYLVVGVMPPGFRFSGQVDVWLPLAPSPTSSRGDHRLGAVGRLKPEVTPDQALRELKAISGQLAAEYPETNKDWGASTANLSEWLIGSELRTRVIALLVAVGLLLLMACVNVANLLLARSSSRAREISVRAAIGAGRGRIMRQLLTESLVLSLLGAGLGVGLAALAAPTLRSFPANAIPRIDQVSLDWRVLSFGVVAALVTGLLFGLAPAVQASRSDLNDLLRSGGRVAEAGRFRSGLIVVSVGLAMVLLVGADLVGRSFVRLTGVDPGFEPERVLVAAFTLPGSRYDNGEKIVRFQAEVAQRVAALPGVEAAGMTNIAPFSGGSTAMPFRPVGASAVGPDEFVQAAWRSVSPGYFAALGIRLLRGRFIDETDREESPTAVVITESFAQRAWPGEDPVGRQIIVGNNQGQPWTVAGVVSDLRDQSLDQEPRPLMYLTFRQIGWPSMWLIVRTASEDPMSVANAVRQEIWAVDRSLPVSGVQPLTELVSNVAAQPRLTMFVFGLFAAAALILAVVGLYGIVAYSVAQRTREIGVQLALGARPVRIVGMVVRQGVVLAGAGIVMGLGAAYLLSRFVASILYGIEPRDLGTFVAVAMVLGASAVLASLVPARAAARLDPVLALRQE